MIVSIRRNDGLGMWVGQMEHAETNWQGLWRVEKGISYVRARPHHEWEARLFDVALVPSNGTVMTTLA